MTPAGSRDEAGTLPIEADGTPSQDSFAERNTDEGK